MDGFLGQTQFAKPLAVQLAEVEVSFNCLIGLEGKHFVTDLCNFTELNPQVLSEIANLTKIIEAVSS